jgi:hypothetical protein
MPSIASSDSLNGKTWVWECGSAVWTAMAGETNDTSTIDASIISLPESLTFCWRVIAKNKVGRMKIKSVGAPAGGRPYDTLLSTIPGNES